LKKKINYGFDKGILTDMKNATANWRTLKRTNSKLHNFKSSLYIDKLIGKQGANGKYRLISL